MTARSHDYIIVGAGTAGCILAHRLTTSGRHDVLLLEQSLLLARNMHFGAVEVTQPLRKADPDQFKRLGDSPVTLQLRLDDGTIIEVAAAAEASDHVQGPFPAEGGASTQQEP